MREVNCNLCGAREFNVVFDARLQSDSKNSQYRCTNDGHGEYYRIVRCRRCGLRYSSPRGEESEIEENYREVKDHLYEQELAGRMRTFARNLRHLARHKEPGVLLDVGCSVGAFLYLAREKGWRAYGIEPSEWCVSKAKELYGLRIKRGTYKDIPQLGVRFDAITMWDVLEHLDDPLQALLNCGQALKEDGVLAFSTMDAGSLYARLCGKRWPWLMKMHIYYFDRAAIRAYLAMAGFEALSITRYSHTVSTDYLLYKLKKINRLIYYALLLLKRTVFFNKNLFIHVKLGDFMEVYARRRTR